MKFILHSLLLTVILVSLAAPRVQAEHRLLAADSSKGRIALLAPDGKIEWEHKIGPLHDFQWLGDGRLLLQLSWTRLVEIRIADNQVVWEYDAQQANGNRGKQVEVHAFQRLADGRTMIAESGPGRIIEVDRDGKLQVEFKLKVEHPHPHRDTRLARKLTNGNYLVCHEGDATVREYDGKGKVVWEYEVPLFGKSPRKGHGVEGYGNKCFSALRLQNGNTLIGTGNGHSVIEVTPQGSVVWKLDQNDLPGIQLAWVTTLQQLENGNLVIGNCHAGRNNPQIVEVDRDKKLVWQFRDWDHFGNALTNSWVLD